MTVLKRLPNLILIALFVSFGKPTWATENPTGVAQTGVNFRASPNGRIITGVNRGDLFDILGTKGDWTKVRLSDGQVGYIYSKYISTRSPEITETEAAFCPACEAKKLAETKSAAEQMVDIAHRTGGASQCLTNKMISSAYSVLKKKYNNRTKGKGKCGVAVRLALTDAGIWPGGGIGDAKNMMPGLIAMGFRNIKTPDMTPDNAPAGTILVYGAASKSMRRYCNGLGTYYGHIEIKENKSSYLYDGHPDFNIQAAYGPACRPLIGVMQMGDTCKTCNSKTKKACGL